VLCYGVASAGQTAAVEPYLIFRKELTLVGSRGYRHTFGRALALLGAGRIQVAPLVTRNIDLTGLADALRERALHHIKTLVTPPTMQ
jgi:threonine dehydrogenase-like Zn-dependent dehydrogenase